MPPGTVVGGKYRILDVAGRGGMGIVYRAEDTKLHRVVALKFLPPALVRSEESRERFLMEARAAAALSHPNICTIYEIYDQEERPFIEMEYVEGRSVRVRIKEHPLEAGEAVEIAIQVAEALEEAHRNPHQRRSVDQHIPTPELSPTRTKLGCRSPGGSLQAAMEEWPVIQAGHCFNPGQ